MREKPSKDTIRKNGAKGNKAQIETAKIKEESKSVAPQWSPYFPKYPMKGGFDISSPEKMKRAFDAIDLDGTYDAQLQHHRDKIARKLAKQTTRMWAEAGIDIEAIKKLDVKAQMKVMMTHVDHLVTNSLVVQSTMHFIRDILSVYPDALEKYVLSEIDLTDKTKFAETSRLLGLLFNFYNEAQAYELEYLYNEDYRDLTDQEVEIITVAMHAVHDAYKTILRAPHNSFFLRKLVEQDAQLVDYDFRVRLHGTKQTEADIKRQEEEMQDWNESRLARTPHIDPNDLLRLSPYELPYLKIAPDTYGRLDKKTGELFFMQPSAENIQALKAAIEAFGKWYVSECRDVDKRSKGGRMHAEFSKVPGVPDWYTYPGTWTGTSFEDKAKSMIEPLFDQKLALTDLKPWGNRAADEKSGVRDFVIFATKMKDMVGEEFYMDPNEFPLATQYAFLNFLKYVDEATVEETREVLNLFDDATGVKVYVATAFDPEAATIVTNIVKILPEDSARTVFTKFAEYVDTADAVESSIVDVVEKTGQANLHEVVRRSLLERATAFLRTCGTPPVSTMPVTERAAYIERELGRLNADASRTAAISREIKKAGGKVTSEEVLGVRVRSVPATELRGMLRQFSQIETVLKSNYKEDPKRGYDYTSQFREAIAKGAGSLADKKDTTLFLATKENEKVHDEDVLACLRFDEIKNKEGKTDRLYFGSFASDQAYMGGGFGEGLLKTAFAETEAKYAGIPIDAHCDPRAPITQKYLEMGFVAIGLEEYEQVPSFSISLDRAHNKRLGTKSLSLEQFVTRAKAADSAIWNGADATYLYAGDTPPDFASLVGKKAENKVLALTRYKIAEEKSESGTGKKIYYAAFELV